MKELVPSFRSILTGEIVVTPYIHDFDKIDPSYSTVDEWEAGFSPADDHEVFYSRKEAAKLVMPDAASKKAAKALRIDTKELESQDYVEGRRQGLFGVSGGRMSTFQLFPGATAAAALGEVPRGTSVRELQERAAIAARKAEHYAATGTKALQRVWEQAALRLQKELMRQLQASGGLGGVKKGKIPTAHWDGSTLRVGTTPVLSLEQLLRGQLLGEDPKLGELWRETAHARVWVKGNLITVQWPNTKGSWRTMQQYYEPLRDALGFADVAPLKSRTRIALVGSGLLVTGVFIASEWYERRKEKQVERAAERAEET